MNPFTDESRGPRLSLDVDLTGGDVATKLRAPESIALLVKTTKPAHLSVGTFALKSMLDATLMGAIIRGDYETVYRTLGTVFGFRVPDGTAPAEPPRKPPVAVPSGTPGAIRHSKTG